MVTLGIATNPYPSEFLNPYPAVEPGQPAHPCSLTRYYTVG